jgi:ABC-type phosphate/phosphonate transport system substrate-binding protein
VGGRAQAGVPVKATWAFLLLLAAPAAAGETSLVVWLPATPVESAARVGEAVTELGAYLSRKVPSVALTVRPFRRTEDAMAYVQASGHEVSLLLTEPSFLMELPADFTVLPACRLVRAGKETQHKVVVVGASGTVTSLAGLKGQSLSLAVGGGEHAARFLSRAIFDGEVNPDGWFGKLVVESDEFAATADVLFGRADAALVSEDNPLLLSHLGKELKVVYTSPAVSLPVLAYRTGAVSAAEQAQVEAALVSLGRGVEDKKILDGLRIEGFARIKDGPGRLERAGLLTLPSDERHQPEVATLAVRDLVLPALPAPEAGKLPFLIGFTLPDLPMPLLEAPKAR